ncbi:EAL domain-containing protein [uncultured Bilophila sp.]|uniref:EAL domain-containing protein n=2 Tax=uncultured Bilophila sp. TaxID=529385 RepID=UPI0026124547|nr:EAL domain-containing protein [uncultured Bilophila sp.]
MIMRDPCSAVDVSSPARSEGAEEPHDRTGDPSQAPSYLNLYKVLGETSSEVVWEQPVLPDAESTFSGDPRFACANSCLPPAQFLASLHPDDRAVIKDGLNALSVGAADSFRHAARALSVGGDWLPVDIYARSLRDSDGRPLYIVGGFRDTTDDGRLDLVPPPSPLVSDIIWERSLDNEAEFAITDDVERVLGHPPSHFRDIHDIFSLLHPEDAPLMQIKTHGIRQLMGCESACVRLRHNDGTWRRMEIRVVTLRDRQGTARRVLCTMRETVKNPRDLSAEVHPGRLSPLTGLYTLEAGQAIIEKNLLTGLNLQALILIDFRNLDEMEAHHGTRWKTLFLQHAAALLRNAARENDVPIHYRPGAFLLFADQYETLREVTDLTIILQQSLSAACRLDEKPDRVDFTLGVAVAPYDALTFSGLLARAEEACDLKSGVNFYDKNAADRFRLDATLLEEERRLEKEQMRKALQTIMDNVDAYLFVVHPERHEILFANRQIRKLRPECVPGSACYRSFFRKDRPCAECAILSQKDCPVEYEGGIVYLQLRQRKIRWLNDETVFLVSGTDVTERMLHARKLEHMAYHDALLDIPNRQAALKKLQHQLRAGEKCAIVLLDISDFKLFNETFGHAKGDLLLKEVSRAIAAFVPEASLYRSGGDEFLILLPGTEGPQAQELAEAIRASFERVLVIEGLEYTCNVDIGISVSPQHGTTPSALITHAELALGEARKEGRGVYLFSKQLDQVLSRKRLLQVLIRSALANDDFEVHFQPLFEIESGRFRKAEALLRLRDGAGAYISPAEFIPVAEESGLIVEVGYRVLDTVCRQLLSTPPRSGQPFEIAVNISAIQLLQTNFAARVMEIIRYHGVDPQQLEFEVTESVFINSFEQVKAVMEQLRAKGIRFALDDFGTGYSSLSYLTHLPISTLKLDRSFISNLETSESNRQVCKAVIDIARHFQMSVVAEGVENREQADIIAALGATSIQGFYYARPLPGPNLIPWLSQHAEDEDEPGSIPAERERERERERETTNP